MQNKEIQTSNSKINKEVINPKKEISLIKPLLSNQNDMIKHKSQSSYNPHSPKNTSNTSNPTSSNNSKKNTALGNSIKQIANDCEINIKNTKKSYNSNIPINEAKNFEEKIIKSEKNIICYNDQKCGINKKIAKKKNNINNSKKKYVNDEKNEKSGRIKKSFE